jgi:hypothetical protein
MLSIVPAESDPAQQSCPSCGAAVAADQQYCLTCGRPCAPLRLPFLEVLASAPAQRAPSAPLASNGYLPPLQSNGSQGPLHRYTGVFALVGVLLLTAVIGLLIGHWASGSASSASGPQVIKLEGLSGTGGAASTSSPEGTTGTGSTANGGGKGSGSKASEHETKAEEKETKEAKLPPPAKQSSSSIQKLSKLSGKQAEEEIKKIGSSPAPIVTGGG